MAEDFTDVTEIPGAKVSRNQIARNEHRYVWAAEFCADKDVAEIACGSGQGLGLLLDEAKSVTAGDITADLVLIGRKHYKDRLPIEELDAQSLPYEDNSKDVLIIFEAIYYLPDFNAFLAEAYRVLRPNGKLLICTANCALPDFNPSPFSTNYHTVPELAEALDHAKFSSAFFGYENSCGGGVKSALMKTAKKAAVKLDLMPKSMKSKEALKRIVFGALQDMPAEITRSGNYVAPTPLNANQVDECHLVIYCAATKLVT